MKIIAKRWSEVYRSGQTIIRGGENNILTPKSNIRMLGVRKI